MDPPRMSTLDGQRSHCGRGGLRGYRTRVTAVLSALLTNQLGDYRGAGFSQIETCWGLSLVKASRVHPPHRSRSRIPAI